VYPAVVNVGRHPTLPEGSVTVEAHALDASPDLYGQRVRLTFLDFLRAEQRFSGVEELRRACYEDLDKGLLLGLEMSIEEMTAMGNPVHHATVEARDALKG
jgi:hypothetical protein